MSKPVSEKWWIPIVVAIITVAGTIVVAIIGKLSEPKPTDSAQTYYRVRVIDAVSRAYVANAKVTIELSGNIIVPIEAITDSNGFAIIALPSEHIDKPGRLIVEAREYQTFNKFINLSLETLPEVVELEKK